MNLTYPTHEPIIALKLKLGFLTLFIPCKITALHQCLRKDSYLQTQHFVYFDFIFTVLPSVEMQN